ncbi:hypothetical protein ElyMa_006325900 [Elysia marginata]|uniref:Uncharacterized protein n=1 Tax=Elysia marginata TaxID=1093978 RepID=A0AAV4HIP0_9GAST|nr:hypothetical protein ElyMa_006325900 [Elysia marginata]
MKQSENAPTVICYRPGVKDLGIGAAERDTQPARTGLLLWSTLCDLYLPKAFSCGQLYVTSIYRLLLWSTLCDLYLLSCGQLYVTSIYPRPSPVVNSM